MPDPLVLAGLLLVLAPLVGSVPVWYPPLIAAWTATREDHIALVGAHRRAWRLANAGFGLATIGTASGLATLAVALLPGRATFGRGRGRARGRVCDGGRPVASRARDPGADDPGAR